MLDELRGFDAILLGAVGTPEVPPGRARARPAAADALRARPLRQPAAVQPAPSRHNDGVDFLVVRENTEGTYAGEGGFLRKGTPHEIATQGSVNTRMGVERCVRFAFDLAQSRDRASTSRSCTRRTCSRSPATCGSARSTTVAAEYPDVATAYNHVDAACIYFVQDPGRYDVIVTDNLFGDILTDLGGAVAGGIGRAASANLNPARTGPSLFEPVHGSAPDIAGTGQADPRAAVISAAMMLRFPRRGRRRGPNPQGRRHDRRCNRHDHARSATRSPPPADVAARRKAPRCPSRRPRRSG